jgi:TonB-linked SusC/RagA family outer membrane protein
MKLNFALLALMILSLQLAATTTNGQDISQIEVSITLKNGTLPDLIIALQNQTGLSFGFPPNYQKEVPAINLDGRKRTVKDILDQVLDGTRLTYKQRKTVVAIFYKDQYRSDIAPENSALQISGKVTDSKTGQALPGVNVIVKGSAIGVTTDTNGNYTIEVPTENDILVFSFIGFKTVEFAVAGRSTIDVTFEEDVNALEEVVVYSTGYDNVSAEKTTGSFSQLNRELINRNVGSDVISRLNGLTPGLMIDQRNGNKPLLNIRGLSTILADDQPLIVVDNFPYNGDLSTINPNDIEDITVLKDAAAASIWGVRAGNGVIVIRTKRGGNRPLQVSLNTNVTIGDKPDLFYRPLISPGDFVDVETKFFDTGYYDARIAAGTEVLSPAVEILLKQRNGDISTSEAEQQLARLKDHDVRNDLKKYFYQTKVTQQYALNFSGGSEKSTYYLSLGYDNNRPNEVGNRDSRVSMTLQNSLRLTNKLTIDTRLAYTNRESQANSNLSEFSGDLFRYTSISPTTNIPYRLPTEFVDTVTQSGFLDWHYNPVSELGRRHSTIKSKNVIGVIGVNYSITEGLSFQAKYQYESEDSDAKYAFDKDSYAARDLINTYSDFDGTSITYRNIPIGGILSTSHNTLTAHNARLQMDYTKEFNQHLITSFAGFEARQIKRDGYSDRFYGYNEDTGSVGSVNYSGYLFTYPTYALQQIPFFSAISGTIDRYRSYYGNVAYTYSGKYTISGSARIDQSNLFGVNTNQKSAPLWSVGAKWRIDKETFIKTDWLSLLNLRVTYGYNGNIPQNVTAFTTAQFIQSSLSGRPAATIVSPPNPNLTWEKSRQINFAVDFGLFNNRISGKIEHYRKNGIDLIGGGPIDPTQGINNFKGNVAGMKGYGWDVEISTLNVDKKFKWRTNVILNQVADKITDYDLPTGSIGNYFADQSINRQSTSYQPIKGRPLFGIYSIKSAGLDPATGNPRGYVNGEPSTDYATIYSTYTFDSLQYHGRALPALFGFLRNTFEYGPWSLSVNIKYSIGNYFMRESIAYSAMAYGAPLGDYSQRWQQPGDEKNTTVPSEEFPADPTRDAFYNASSDLVEKADNIRLQDVRLSYRLNSKLISKLHLTEFEIYSYVNNVGILWKATDSWVDPDYPSLPPPRTIAFGMRLTF